MSDAHSMTTHLFHRWRKNPQKQSQSLMLIKGMIKQLNTVSNGPPNLAELTDYFYRAMHVVIARYCYRMSSVRPSVCLSVCLSDSVRPSVRDVDVPWAHRLD